MGIIFYNDKVEPEPSELIVITNSRAQSQPKFSKCKGVKIHCQAWICFNNFQSSQATARQTATQDTIFRHPLGLNGFTSLNVL